MTDSPTITRTLVPEDQRLAVTAELFGVHFIRLEAVMFNLAERMTRGSYRGGYWDFYILDNGGFYMAPAGDQLYKVSCDNHWKGTLSSDAIGVVCSLYAYSHLSFSRDMPFARVCADHYHLLREYMFSHPEVSAILGATD